MFMKETFDNVCSISADKSFINWIISSNSDDKNTSLMWIELIQICAEMSAANRLSYCRKFAYCYQDVYIYTHMHTYIPILTISRNKKNFNSQNIFLFR